MKYVEVNRDCGEFQLPLTQDQMAQLVQRAFGTSTDIVTTELQLTGKFNTCYQITIADQSRQRLQTVILRVAPPATVPIFMHEHCLLRREYAVQPFLASVTDLTPCVLFSDFTQDIIERDYVFLNYIDGLVWDNVKDSLSEKQNISLWQQLGSVVKQIHCVTGNAYGPPITQKPFHCWSEAVIALIAAMQSDLDTYHAGSESVIRQVLKLLGLTQQHRWALDSIARPYLVHGDLWPKNILIQADGDDATISGLLDSERAFWGDPAAEWIFSFLDIPDPFWQAYGRNLSEPLLTHEQLIRRKIYEGRGAIQLILEGWRFNFDTVFAETILVDAVSALDKL